MMPWGIDVPECECGRKKNIITYGTETFIYCPWCDGMPDDPRGTILCDLCKEAPFSHRHHTSYLFDETIRVCSGCHGRIHDTTDVYSEYQPEMSRSDAEALGLV